MSNKQNPLTKFYRTPALSVKIPSRGKYYADGIVNLNDDDEISILPMTAQDEVTLQNPDALLSGEAVISAIKSCVPGISNPKKLLSCDIDVLMIAIRVASYGDNATMQQNCPKCKESNEFNLNLDTLLNHTDVLDEHYEVVLNGELTVFVAPSKFENVVRQQKTAFENTKLEQAISSPDLSDGKRLKILSQVLDKVSKFTFDQTLDAVIKVLFTDEDGEIIEVTDRQHITDWLHNIDKTTIEKVQDKVAEVNGIGIEKSFPAKCSKCEHQWEAIIEFNPVNFS